MRVLLLVAICFTCFTGLFAGHDDIPEIYRKHPEFGMIKPENPKLSGSYELIHKRTEYSRVFKNADGSFTTAKSSRPLHYKDSQNWWRTINYNSFSMHPEDNKVWLYPENNPEFIFNSQTLKTTRINNNEQFIVFNAFTELNQYNENNDLISSDITDPEKAEPYYENTRVFINDIIDGMNFEQYFQPGLFKTNYHLLDGGSIYEDAVIVSVGNIIEIPAGWRLEPDFSVDFDENSFSGNTLVLFCENNKARAVLPHPVFTDSRLDSLMVPVVNQFTRPAHVDFYSERNVSTAEGYYKVEKIGESQYMLRIIIEAEWLRDPQRVYPVIIDPVVIIDDLNIQISCFYPEFESDTLAVSIPEGDTIIYTYLLWDYTAAGGSGAWMSDQVSYVSGINGATAEYHGEGDNSGVQTYSTYSNILNTISEGSVDLVFHASRIWGPNYDGGDCDAVYNYISRRYAEVNHFDEISFEPGIVVINEYCASNRFMQDEFGNYEDWIELYNPNPYFVDLEGYHLSDNPNNPTKWQFPSVMIAPMSHLLVYCSGRDVVHAGTPHTNFRLTQLKPESVVFADPDGVILESYEMWTTQNGHSVGRVECGGEEWGISTTPTAGGPNSGHKPGYTSTPIFSIDGGFYSGPVTLSLITYDFDSEIRYTINGNEPTAESILYTEPIEIDETTVIRARVFANNPDILPGFIETNTYFIDVFHTLPVFSFSGDQIQVLFGGTQIKPYGAVEYFDETGQFVDKAYSHFNKHGNDSWSYPQRGVDFIARDEYGYSRRMEHKFFMTSDRTRFKRLMVKAAANDNYPFENGGAHIRDSYAQHLSQVIELDLDERSSTNCIVYLNGQYWGVYDLREKVDDKDYTDYYYDQDRKYKGSHEYIQFLKTWGYTAAKYGGSPAVQAWNNFRNFVTNNDMSDSANIEYVKETLNLESYIDYFVINSFIVSRDWLNYNTGWWRGLHPDGEAKKWRYILWDQEAAFGHYTNWTGLPDVTYSAAPCNVEALNVGNGHAQMLNKLISENEYVRHKYITRYADLKNTHFKCENLLYVLDSMVAVITPEMPAQIERWGGSVQGWEQNVENLRNWIQNRCDVFSERLKDCYDLTGPYDVVVDIYPPGTGQVKMNSFWVPYFPFDADVYGNIETHLTAKANSSYEFSHWEIAGNEIIPDIYDPDIIINFTEDDVIIAHFTDANLDGKDLLYYWHFNDLAAENEDVTSIDADYSYWPTADPKMIYTGTGDRDMDVYQPGTEINALMGSQPGKAARVRNSAYQRSLVFNMPTYHYSDIIFEYAVHRSANGMLNNVISYSIDGTNFIQDDLDTTSFEINEDYQLIAVDFSHIYSVNNNPNFHVKISFEGNTQQTNGNNRFDNISLKGLEMDVSDVDEKNTAELNIYPNPFLNRIYIESDSYMNKIEMYCISGKLVYSRKMNYTKNFEMPVSAIPQGMYIIKINGENNFAPQRVVKR